MKIPEKPVFPAAGPSGVVLELQQVKDSGPTQRKEAEMRVDSVASAQSIELAARLREGRITLEQAIHTVVDSVVKSYAAKNDDGLREMLMSQLQTDPALRRLAAMLGADDPTLSLLENTGKEPTK